MSECVVAVSSSKHVPSVFVSCEGRSAYTHEHACVCTPLCVESEDESVYTRESFHVHVRTCTV